MKGIFSILISVYLVSNVSTTTLEDYPPVMHDTLDSQMMTKDSGDACKGNGGSPVGMNASAVLDNEAMLKSRKSLLVPISRTEKSDGGCYSGNGRVTSSSTPTGNHTRDIDLAAVEMDAAESDEEGSNNTDIDIEMKRPKTSKASTEGIDVKGWI